MITEIRVQVGEKVKTYPAMIAEFGDYLVTGYPVLGLSDALASAKKLLGPNSIFVSALYWVILDDSGLAYNIEVRRSGHWEILGASPRQGINNVKDLYVA